MLSHNAVDIKRQSGRHHLYILVALALFECDSLFM